MQSDPSSPVSTEVDRRRLPTKLRAYTLLNRLRAPAAILLALIAVYWKILLTSQYSFLDHPDGGNQILPWLNVQVYAIRHLSWMFWDPYTIGGQSLIGQVQPGVVSPFTFLLALFPLSPMGHVQIYSVHVWFVLIHFAGALFAYALFRDLHCPRSAAALGAIFYATAGFVGNIGWPQLLAPAIWAPLVFLFLLRSLRGRRPVANAALAGVALGASWLCGHHVPSLFLTLAVFGTAFTYVAVRPGFRVELLRRIGVLSITLVLISAAQILPAVEYGMLSLRWAPREHAWDSRISVAEHELSGLQPLDILHLILPASGTALADPFSGVVALSLIALAVWCAFRRAEVRLFCVLGICALLYSLPRHAVLYGFFYALVPMVEKAREPLVALSIFHFCAAALAAAGATVVVRGLSPSRNRVMIRGLLWFAGLTLGLFYLGMFLRPTVNSFIVEGDSRILMIAFVGALAAAAYRASELGFIRRTAAVAMLAGLIVIEQGNEVPWFWAHQDEIERAPSLKPLFETADVADFLNAQPKPLRVEWNHKDLEIDFADWNRIDALDTSGASQPLPVHRLGPWNDSVSHLYGVGYTISRAPDRPNQREIFSGKAGYKVFANPDALPRAWTVHRVMTLPNIDVAVDVVANGRADLRTSAVMTGDAPRVATCSAPDRVQSIDERLASVTVRVQMACEGLLVVGDNWYPGWRAAVDGHGSPIFVVDTAIRGVVVGPGTHEVTMTYRPWRIYIGLLMLAIGLGGAIRLAIRVEPDGVDVLHARAFEPV